MTRKLEKKDIEIHLSFFLPWFCFLIRFFPNFYKFLICFANVSLSVESSKHLPFSKCSLTLKRFLSLDLHTSLVTSLNRLSAERKSLECPFTYSITVYLNLCNIMTWWEDSKAVDSKDFLPLSSTNFPHMTNDRPWLICALLFHGITVIQRD